jgi:hypothetical protein
LVQTQWRAGETPTGPLPMPSTWGCQCLVRLGLPLYFPNTFFFKSLKEKVPQLCFFKQLKELTTYEQLLQSEKRKYFVRTGLNKNLETPGFFHMQVIQNLDPIVL